MKAKCIKPGVVLSILLIPFLSFSNVEFNHQKDVVYGYKDGMALGWYNLGYGRWNDFKSIMVS